MLAEVESQIRMRRLTDRAQIVATLTHPRIFPHISDDGCQSPEQFEPGDIGSFIYLAAYRGDEYIGLFALHAQNLVTYEVHTCLLPGGWGKDAETAARECIAWVFEHTPCRRLITNVPSDNALALRLALLVGMEPFGRNPRSIQRGGVLLDQVMLGISKEP